jgi:hypothetical protein
MYLVVEGTYPLNFLCKAPSVYRIARELWTPSVLTTQPTWFSFCWI